MNRLRAAIGLGANLGDARATLQAAAGHLQGQAGLRWVAGSRLYRSAPIDSSGPDYLNAVALVDSALDADALLRLLQSIETAHGRERPYRNAPRSLDLDLLFIGDQQRSDTHLQLPHPRLHQRAFVLRPLLELAPTLALPGLGPLAAYLPQVAGQAIEALDETLLPGLQALNSK